MDGQAPTSAPGGWPEPAPGQVEVLLLGTNHMTDSRLDDVLAAERQRELRRLVDRLATWEPDGVAVELPEAHQADVDGLYWEYRTGERAYDEETEVGPFSPYVDDPLRECRGEPVQAGFRLADRLDHDRVHAVDYPMTLDGHLDEEETEAVDQDAFQHAHEHLSVPVPRPSSTEDRTEQWNESTIPEFLRWLNREESLRSNDRHQFAMALVSFDHHYAGARFLAAWYERNLRILENLWRAADDDTDRIVLVIGYAHVHVLRAMLADAPPFCPANPLPVLAD